MISHQNLFRAIIIGLCQVTANILTVLNGADSVGMEEHLAVYEPILKVAS